MWSRRDSQESWGAGATVLLVRFSSLQSAEGLAPAYVPSMAYSAVSFEYTGVGERMECQPFGSESSYTLTPF